MWITPSADDFRSRDSADAVAAKARRRISRSIRLLGATQASVVARMTFSAQAMVRGEHPTRIPLIMA